MVSTCVNSDQCDSHTVIYCVTQAFPSLSSTRHNHIKWHRGDIFNRVLTNSSENYADGHRLHSTHLASQKWISETFG